jgi:hypothetical protein
MLMLLHPFVTLAIAGLALSAPAAPQAPQSTASTPEAKAYQHLSEVMDQYHQAFDVYTDLDAGGNHFVHRAKMGTAVSTDDAYTGTAHSGSTSIANSFSGTGTNWGGWSFQNGVLPAGTTRPTDNWGSYPNAGINLSGATALTFWARGAKGNERVEFFAFGMSGAYPDSAPKRTTCGATTPCYVTLSTSWQQYTITLSGLNLSYITQGFGWVTNAPQNGNQPITFYLDDIRYNKPHQSDLHFLTSYEPAIPATAADRQLRQVAYTYDNALALSAFVAEGDWTRAKLLADAFVYAHQHDRAYTDGRLRNAYTSGDLVLPPGWSPSGSARIPGYWDAAHGSWMEDSDQVGTSTGNVAWAMLALLDYYKARGGATYLTAAQELGQWVVANTYDERGAGGYTGGFVGHEPAPTQQLWKSTEHNLDLVAAFTRLYEATGNAAWQAYAQHARDFVSAMNVEGRYFATGTQTDGVTINPQAVPLDTQSWSFLALGDTALTRAALATAEVSHTVSYAGFEGFDFNTDRDMPWPEGTAQMVVAYGFAKDNAQSQRYLNALRWLQANATHGNAKGLVAAPADGLTTGFGWVYNNRLHVGATAWMVFAERHYNPFYGTYPYNTYLAVVLGH